MRLKRLKLAGFKSFVDPTVVHFPGQLLAVVGPNGCGKSNIIDAFRWVLGESSAKHLRGESMTDVIFNGSTHRKPVGQASVELVFENNLGRLTGALSSFAEISIKRVVTRDGDSNYFLNGSRCRRRDITDIFLGTGANARGYSIIGQGTISRLVEAKPEEMRVFLEEAAGVSKYKERRKETLQRIRHTRDNLERVSDIRDELGKQLQRLERQAKAAERYTQLKQEEGRCRAEIMALKWQDLHQQQAQKQQALNQLAVDMEKQQAELTHSETRQTLLNEQALEANDQTQQIQAEYYQMAADIARLEESIQQQQKEKKRLEEDSLQIAHDIAQAKEQQKRDQDEEQAATLRLEQLKEQVLVLEKEHNICETAYQDARLRQERWQADDKVLQAKQQEHQHQMQNLQLKLEHVEQRRGDLYQRIEKLQMEIQNVNMEGLLQGCQKHQDEHALLQGKQEDVENKLRGVEAELSQTREVLEQLEQQLQETHDQYQHRKSQSAALQAAHQAALGQQEKPLPESWQDKPRLIDCLEVDADWQLACEMVFQDRLQGVVVESFEALSTKDIEAFQGNLLSLYPASSPTKKQVLADKIQGDIPAVQPCLESIYLADSLQEALERRSGLSLHESLITKEGFWLGKTWLRRVDLSDDDQAGHLHRKQQIQDLAGLLKKDEEAIERLKSQRDQSNVLLKDANQTQLALSKEHQELKEALRDQEAQIKTLQLNMEQRKERLHSIAQEMEDDQDSLEALAEEKAELSERQAQLIHAAEALKVEQSKLDAAKDDDMILRSLQQDEASARQRLRAVELDIERERIKVQQYQERNERALHAIAQLEQRLASIEQRIIEQQQPDKELYDTLPAKLEQHQQLEVRLNLSREQGLTYRSALDALQLEIKQKEAVLRDLQEQRAQLTLEEKALAVKADTLLESLNETPFELKGLLEGLNASMSVQDKEKQLLAIIERIHRLGAINLAAIEEYASEGERKRYLDDQCNDLNEALEGLEQAIDKMDRETRQRLKTTFDEVNETFKSLFPRLFGGGRAQLELTCDNLLEAGIVVMAQPPGKRNSTIHLLSGGEKAMTAVALVFAIFRLNPSPFCMLDEVDAPLDDVNVGRFCALVKEMSEYIQFLFITHNKVTMEMASQLIGVTMREPGVSRLVAVDVQQALSME